MRGTPLTDESIAKAKAQMKQDRKAMGIGDAPIVFGPRLVARELLAEDLAAVKIHCPRAECKFAASARTEGRAVRELAHHLVLAHMQRGA